MFFKGGGVGVGGKVRFTEEDGVGGARDVQGGKEFANFGTGEEKFLFGEIVEHHHFAFVFFFFFFFLGGKELKTTTKPKKQNQNQNKTKTKPKQNQKTKPKTHLKSNLHT